MTKEPTLAEQEMLAETRRRAEATKARRELRVELVVNLAFIAAVAALFLLPSPQPLEPGRGGPDGDRDVRRRSGFASTPRSASPSPASSPSCRCSSPSRWRSSRSPSRRSWPRRSSRACSPGRVRGRSGSCAASPTPGSPSVRRSCSRSPTSGPTGAGPLLLVTALAAQFAGDFARRCRLLPHHQRRERALAAAREPAGSTRSTPACRGSRSSSPRSCTRPPMRSSRWCRCSVC